jgi:hypothetical protein
VVRVVVCCFAIAACGFQPQVSADGQVAPPDSADDCTPNALGCNGRVSRTCGADGHWNPALDQTCAFTCSLGACVAPSNLMITEVAACTSAAPPLAPPAGATVVVTASSGTHITCSPDCGMPGLTSIQSISMHGTNPGYSLFCVSKLALPAGTTFSLPSTGGPSEAIAIVSDSTVDIAGTIAFDGGPASSALAGGVGGPGGYDGADRSGGTGLDGHGPCPGKGGDNSGSSDHWVGGGGGGGGYATAGAGGGTGRCKNGDHTASGNIGGTTCGVATLVPVVGGSGGGSGGDATTGVQQGWAGGGGGGALQIASRGTFTLSGTISARGGAGYGVSGTAGIDGGGGGGAGGALLLEAPTFAVTGQLVVDGGSGGVSGSGVGGAGATGTTAPIGGLSFTANGQGGSGGGGAGGRIRINGGNASCAFGSSPISSCSAGMLAPQ